MKVLLAAKNTLRAQKRYGFATELRMRSALRSGALTLIGLALSGCLASSPTTDDAGLSGASQCEPPRPRVCTMAYEPVCAALLAGTQKTYASGCNACADIAVASYVDGACENDQRL